MIRLWRSFIGVLGFTFFGFGAGVISFIIFPYIHFFLPENKQKKAYSEVVHRAWNFFIRLLIKIRLVNIEISDKDKLRNLSGKVIVANHPTFIDIVILIGLIPNSTCLAKKATLKNPFFRNIVKSIYIINDIDLEKLKEDSAKYLSEGFNIVIFPSGTRTKPDEDFKIHKGSSAIALNSGVEIIPVKITTDIPFLQKGQLFCDMGAKTAEFKLEVKEPINPKDYANLPEIKARNAISEKIKEQII